MTQQSNFIQFLETAHCTKIADSYLPGILQENIWQTMCYIGAELVISVGSLLLHTFTVYCYLNITVVRSSKLTICFCFLYSVHLFHHLSL